VKIGKYENVKIREEQMQELSKYFILKTIKSTPRRTSFSHFHIFQFSN